MIYRPTWDLSTVPTPLIRAEAGRRLPKAKGADKVLRPCPHCRKDFGCRELRKHIPTCPKKS